MQTRWRSGGRAEKQEEQRSRRRSRGAENQEEEQKGWRGSREAGVGGKKKVERNGGRKEKRWKILF